jgi:hypothetical protein
MLIPVKPARSLARPSKRGAKREEIDVHVEVIPFKDDSVKKVGRAKVSGRTEAINRRPP